MKYEWGARKDVALESCKMGVYVNGKLIKAHVPFGYFISQETSTIQFSENVSNPVELSFCGEGTNDGGGAILNKVSLKEY